MPMFYRNTVPSLMSVVHAAWRAVTAALLLAALVQPGVTPALAAPAPRAHGAAAAPRPATIVCTTVVSITGDSGVGSLRDAVACATVGGTVTFSSTVAGSTINLTTGEITVTKQLTIDGSGAAGVKVSAGNLSRIFNITTTAPVTLTALILQNGADPVTGGAVYAATNDLVLSQTSVLSSSVSGFGGGIYALGRVSVIGGRFENNYCYVNGCQGGGLYSRGNLTLTGTQFISNTAVENGGGVYVQFGSTALTGGRFERNSCSGLDCTGGGLHTDHALTLTGTEFISNSSWANGAGLFVLGEAALVGGRLEGNVCVLLCEGGGLSTGQSLTLSGTQVINNESTLGGGGIYVNNIANLQGGQFESNNCTGPTCTGGGLHAARLFLSGDEFVNNTAGLGGGAYIDQDAHLNGGLFQANACTYSFCNGGGLQANSLDLVGATFLSNTSQIAGGGAYALTAALQGGLFQGNQCLAAMCGGGGLRGDGLVITNTQFISNTSNGSGGGGGVYARVSVRLVGGLFERNANLVDSYGGAVFLESFTTTVQISGTTFISNTSQGHGGAVFGYTEVHVTGASFQGNGCPGTTCLGGAINAGTVVATDTEFISNTSVPGAGAIFVYDTARLTDSSFQGNSCTGVFCATGALIATYATLTNTDFISNTSPSSGGAVQVIEVITMTNGVFRGNSCTGSSCTGGAVSASTAVVLAGTQFLTNTSLGGGGAIATFGTVTGTNGLFQGNSCSQGGCTGGGLRGGLVTLNATSFYNNTSQGNGGGASTSATRLTGGVFQGNGCASSCQGGGLSASSLVLTDTQFLSNTSTSNGGGVRASGAVTLTGGLFEWNSCTGNGCDGGGLTAASLVLNGTQFISNTVRDTGAGANVTGAATVTNGHFERNTCLTPFSTCDGGGLRANTAVLTGTTFLSNTTQDRGGGLMAANGVTLTDSLFQGNTCTAVACEGGGLYAGAGVSAVNSAFTGNTAGSGGGLVVSGTLTLANVTLSGNTAGVQGGAVYLTGTAGAQLLNLTVVSNTAPSGGALSVPVAATVGLSNTLFSGNGAAACAGEIDFGASNLEWLSTSCAAAGPTVGFTNTDPLLGPLAFNAPGATPTHALLEGSSAIDAGDAATCAAAPVNNLDQRGVTRPIDGDDVSGAVCDLGAYEAAELPEWVLYLPVAFRSP